jgi:hypothetical protein
LLICAKTSTWLMDIASCTVACTIISPIRMENRPSGS